MTVGRWLTNWKNGATLVAAVLVALVAFTVVDASRARDQALDLRDRTATAATRRIDRLNDRIEQLGDQLVSASEHNGQRIGELTAQIEALQEQVRQLGGRPVVVTPTTTSAPGATTSTTSSTTTTTGRCVGVVCLPATPRSKP